MNEAISAIEARLQYYQDGTDEIEVVEDLLRALNYIEIGLDVRIEVLDISDLEKERAKEGLKELRIIRERYKDYVFPYLKSEKIT